MRIGSPSLAAPGLACDDYLDIRGIARGPQFHARRDELTERVGAIVETPLHGGHSRRRGRWSPTPGHDKPSTSLRFLTLLSGRREGPAKNEPQAPPVGVSRRSDPLLAAQRPRRHSVRPGLLLADCLVGRLNRSHSQIWYIHAPDAGPGYTKRGGRSGGPTSCLLSGTHLLTAHRVPRQRARTVRSRSAPRQGRLAPQVRRPNRPLRESRLWTSLLLRRRATREPFPRRYTGRRPSRSAQDAIHTNPG